MAQSKTSLSSGMQPCNFKAAEIRGFREGVAEELSYADEDSSTEMKLGLSCSDRPAMASVGEVWT